MVSLLQLSALYCFNLNQTFFLQSFCVGRSQYKCKTVHSQDILHEKVSTNAFNIRYNFRFVSLIIQNVFEYLKNSNMKKNAISNLIIISRLIFSLNVRRLICYWNIRTHTNCTQNTPFMAQIHLQTTSFP